jgi:hypothetical protein
VVGRLIASYSAFDVEASWEDKFSVDDVSADHDLVHRLHEVREGREAGRCEGGDLMISEGGVPSDHLVHQDPEGPVVHRLVVTTAKDDLRSKVPVRCEASAWRGED